MWSRGVSRRPSLLDRLSSVRQESKSSTVVLSSGGAAGVRESSGQQHLSRQVHSGPKRNSPEEDLFRRPSKHAQQWIREAEAEGRPVPHWKRKQMEYEAKQRTPRWTPESLQQDPRKEKPWWKERKELGAKTGGRHSQKHLPSGRSTSRSSDLESLRPRGGAPPAAPKVLAEAKNVFMGASREKFMLRQRNFQDSRDGNLLAQVYERPALLEEAVQLWSGGVISRAEWYSNRVRRRDFPCCGERRFGVL